MLGRCTRLARHDLAAVQHEQALQIRRSLVVGDGVYTVSDNGVLASSLATLVERGWAAFPLPAAQPPPIGIP